MRLRHWVKTQMMGCLYLITDPYLIIMSLFSVSTHHLSLNSMPLPNHLSNCLYLITDPYLIIMSLFSVSTHHLSLNSMPRPDHLSYCLYLITNPYLIIMSLFSVSTSSSVLNQCLYHIISIGSQWLSRWELDLRSRVTGLTHQECCVGSLSKTLYLPSRCSV